MATYCHPITGVLLNDIEVRRKALDFDDAVTVHVMRLQGHGFTDIVQKLGTNPFRVGEVLKGDVHPEAAVTARRRLLH